MPDHTQLSMIIDLASLLRHIAQPTLTEKSNAEEEDGLFTGRNDDDDDTEDTGGHEDTGRSLEVPQRG